MYDTGLKRVAMSGDIRTLWSMHIDHTPATWACGERGKSRAWTASVKEKAFVTGIRQAGTTCASWRHQGL